MSVGPVGRVAGVYVIHVAVEHDRAALVPAAQQADHVAPIVGPHLVIVQSFHLVADQAGDRLLVARWAGRPDQLLAEGDHLGSALFGQ
jgi:hypothetical protein